MRLSGIDTIHNLPFSKFPPFFKLSPIYLMDDISKMYKYVSINKLYNKLTFMDEVLYSEEQ